MVHELFATLIDWYMANVNYGTVTLLMAVESSFIPFPSEIVVPPAAWKAAQGELNIYLVFISATVGAIIGALANYYLAMFLGRSVVYRLADTKLSHMLMIKKESIEKAEQYFIKYGKSSTFIGRLVPAIRQLISLPAGIARMNLPTFLGFTILGSGLWNVILCVLGYFLWTQKALLERYYKGLSYGFLIVGVLFGAFIVLRAIKGSKKPKADAA